MQLGTAQWGTGGRVGVGWVGGLRRFKEATGCVGVHKAPRAEKCKKGLGCLCAALLLPLLKFPLTSKGCRLKGLSL